MYAHNYTNEVQYQTLMGQYVARRKAEHGDKFDASDLYPNFIWHFNAGRNRRVKVAFADGRVKWGTIGVTTGWKPCFLLLHNRYSRGSSETIGSGDQVIDYKDLPR
jgi:hypothetical protein